MPPPKVESDAIAPTPVLALTATTMPLVRSPLCEMVPLLVMPPAKVEIVMEEPAPVTLPPTMMPTPSGPLPEIVPMLVMPPENFES
jgi:hypothetical protein